MRIYRVLRICLSFFVFSFNLATASLADDYDAAITAALELAATNRAQMEAALQQVPADQREGMRFVVANMPTRDLTSLSAEFLLENSELAYREWKTSPWKDQIPNDLFLNDVLPYASINERRDAWRKQFIDQFKPLVADVQTPGQAAAILNQKIFGIVNVKYSTSRPKADQSPLESINAGLASCSGLSVLLIDACRAVGIPARFVGTPLWPDKSGNHSWVEVWDNGWHFTGAAESAGDKLDEAWFTVRASTARRDHPFHAIYATSYRKTPLTFPLIWDRSIDYVHAVNVTDRYAGRAEPLADGYVQVMFRVTGAGSKQRCAAQMTVRDAEGTVVWEGETKDERFDANDHVTIALRTGANYQLQVRHEQQQETVSFAVRPDRQLIEIQLQPPTTDSPTLNELKQYLAQAVGSRPSLAEQPFARQPLSRAEAESARKRLWDDHSQQVRLQRAAEMEERKLRIGDLEMRFDLRLFGDVPPSGRSLFISMHGGGGAPKEINDQQWENQKRLYRLEEGAYVTPRAPTDTWDLWHQAHIDRFFDRLIENLVVFENVDPNRVYVMGYSAGGDGVYQLAPRMADRLAAAAMMAGHPNESSPLGLRNLPFTIHVGGNDDAYNRNKVAAEWGRKLDQLREADPQGYEHWVEIYPDKGHWLDRQDAAAIPWMAKFTRNPAPPRVVWYQDDVTESRFYWLAVEDEQRKAGTQVSATRNGQNVELEAPGVSRLRVRWNDQLADLEQPVTVSAGGKTRFAGRVERTIATLAQTLAERGDPASVYSAETVIDLTGE